MPTDSQLARLSPAEREDYEERAAILEHDGGFSRADAEHHAYAAIAAAQRQRRETGTDQPFTQSVRVVG